MLNMKAILLQVADPRGKQGQDYRLWSILALIVVSLLCGRRGMKAAFLFGRSLTRRQQVGPGFRHGRTLSPAMLTETLGAWYFERNGGPGHIAIDYKTMPASKEGEGKAAQVLSAFCVGLQNRPAFEASRGKGLETPDPLQLLERLDFKVMIFTGDAMFLQKFRREKRTQRGRDCIVHTKGNQISRRMLAGERRNGFQGPNFFPRER